MDFVHPTANVLVMLMSGDVFTRELLCTGIHRKSQLSQTILHPKMKHASGPGNEIARYNLLESKKKINLSKKKACHINKELSRFREPNQTTTPPG